MTKVYRCFTEKMPGFDVAAMGVLETLRNEQGISALKNLRMLCRYDTQGIDDATYTKARGGVFSEPACDRVFDETLTVPKGWNAIIIESLPGQFDMRADSCSQCIAMMTQGERPLVRCATVYLLEGALSAEDIEKAKKALINPVEARLAKAEKPEKLDDVFPVPPDVETLDGLIADGGDLDKYIHDYALAMDRDDLAFLREYFQKEGRAPTVTELKMIDTYWSDHCRHTTFSTHLENPAIKDPMVLASYEEYLAARRELYGDKAQARPVTLMDIATCGAKILKKRGILQNLDESEEINACSVKIDVSAGGAIEPWLLMFKNETHNHPTEIEPFGGAATCLGGAIRDPLSGRSYVYQAMRVTGAADPRLPLEKTMENKLPQRVICRKAAAGYSSYGNQIGLATGLVSELYHDGYVAKRLETGAVVGAVPAAYVRRAQPEAGDIVLLLGGKTGRDGCGGATGSSKSHSSESLATCGAEVQKGNAPEERKIQRFFRNPNVSKMIKRCNDFGAGGVSVAVGELADGLDIDLDTVPKKYEGLDGTELAISESQERMAVVLAPCDTPRFRALAAAENLETTVVATVIAQPRLRMRWRGKIICDITRAFLDTNGAKKYSGVTVNPLNEPLRMATEKTENLQKRCEAVLKALNAGLQKGLGTRFDGSIGGNSVLMPYGGKNQLTPTQAMAAKLPVLDCDTDTCSVMAYGFDPAFTAQNPYVGAQAAVLSSLSKLTASGCDPAKAYLSFQEFFEKPSLSDTTRIGKPFSALLGAFSAQTALKVGAIGGKDSMSGSFNDIDVPPTLISFAIAVNDASRVISPEFKAADNGVYLFKAPYKNGAPDLENSKKMLDAFAKHTKEGKILSAWSLQSGAALEGICKMAIGNDIGFKLDKNINPDVLFELNYGGIIAECEYPPQGGILLGVTVSEPVITLGDTEMRLDDVKAMLLHTLDEIYPVEAKALPAVAVPKIEYTKRSVVAPAYRTPKPTAIIPVFPGTNCEYDTQRAVIRAGGSAKLVLVRNLTPDMLKQSVSDLVDALRQAQMLIIPGGFSGGDEPDGSGKFIQALLRGTDLTCEIDNLLNKRGGLVLGICNGFQALIKLGLLPFGKICDIDETCPTLTFNTIGRHQSIYANTRIASVKSPWLAKCQVGETYNIPFSHGEGRFMADEQTMRRLIENGQIATQYCDENGTPSMSPAVNINGSVYGVEGITSPDGRVLGKMGHSERRGDNVAKNIGGNKFQPIFESGVEYFK